MSATDYVAMWISVCDKWIGLCHFKDVHDDDHLPSGTRNGLEW